MYMKLSYRMNFSSTFPSGIAATSCPGVVDGVEFVDKSQKNDKNSTHYISCGSLTKEKCESIAWEVHDLYRRPMSPETHNLYNEPFSLKIKLPQNTIDRQHDHLDIVRFITLKMISAIIDKSGFDSSSSPFSNKQKIRLILWTDAPMEKKINDICDLANEALEKRMYICFFQRRQ